MPCADCNCNRLIQSNFNEGRDGNITDSLWRRPSSLNVSDTSECELEFKSGLTGGQYSSVLTDSSLRKGNAPHSFISPNVSQHSTMSFRRRGAAKMLSSCLEESVTPERRREWRRPMFLNVERTISISLVTGSGA